MKMIGPDFSVVTTEIVIYLRIDEREEKKRWRSVSNMWCPVGLVLSADEICEISRVE